MTSHSFFSSPPSTLLNLQSSKSKPLSLLPHPPFSDPSKSFRPTSLKTVKITPFCATTVDKPISSSDQGGDELAAARIGSKIRVKVSLKVYHIPKVPEFDLEGKIGTLKQYVGFHKGKTISANLPYKVEFKEDGIEGRDGPVKFLAHLKEDEFEYID